MCSTTSLGGEVHASTGNFKGHESEYLLQCGCRLIAVSAEVVPAILVIANRVMDALAAAAEEQKKVQEARITTHSTGTSSSESIREEVIQESTSGIKENITLTGGEFIHIIAYASSMFNRIEY